LESKQFEIKYDGSDFDIDQKGLSISDYGIERVKVVKTEIQEGDNQTVSINFFGTLRKGQDFKDWLPFRTPII
jgi:hypothetical protein